MSIAERLREERMRLGLSQPALATAAGASRSAVVSWEKGVSAPTAASLAGMADAGLDILYVITGRRTADQTENAASQIEEQLADIRRNMLDPARHRLPGEDEHQAEQRVLEGDTNALKAMLNHDRAFMSPEVSQEVEHLLDIIENSASLSLYRAADRVQLRRKRDDVRRGIREWLEGAPYEPDEAVMYMLTVLAMEYGAPVRFLTELVYEMHRNITETTAKD